MQTRVLTVDAEQPDPALIAEAAAVLRQGGLVAFPTETVYGLGALALDASAVGSIFRAKGRPAFNPLIVHVLDAAMARPLVSFWPAAAERLSAAFWPGPLSLVLPRAAHVPDAVTAGLPNVALRAPAHPVARALIAAVGAPVAAPSANLSTAISPTRASHVRKGLEGRIDLILDGGTTAVGVESTVLSLVDAEPVLLRPGGIARSAIEALIGPVRLRAETPAGEAARPSPGLMAVHYAPRVPTWHVSAAALPGVLARAGRQGLVTFGMAVPLPQDWHQVVLPAEPLGAAAGFYAALHDLEDAGVTAIWIQEPPADPAWEAVTDRLMKASRPAPL